MTEEIETTETKNIFEEYVDLNEKLMTSIVNREMAKNGVIGQYPQKYEKEIKDTKKLIVKNLIAQQD